MHEANLTRFGPERCEGPGSISGSFKAIDGDAKIILSHTLGGQVNITLNGEELKVPTLNGDVKTELAIRLAGENTISVSSGADQGMLELRITQITQADLRLQRQGYFGLNTSDMESQRGFYKLLGFKGEIYPAGPETSQTFAQALGFEDDYLIYVSLHSLQDPPEMPFVDTVQFRDASYREEPPYAHLNHIGMAYATYSTTDLDGDYTFLQEHGVDFLSSPAQAPDGERFVFFKEQDGAFIKLVDAPNGGVSSKHPNLVRLVNTNMNVRDLERSREFYRLLGFSESVENSQAGEGEFAQAHGFDEPIAYTGMDVSLGEGTDGATLQLRQWQTPYDDESPYPPPVNHLGIDRINFYVENVNETVRIMNELGFEQLGPIGGPPEIGIVFFFDPDGIKVQFAGPRGET
ncbi:MAG: VOC family protein [Pseudomonadota bacterium]